jgi:hypothetical protein
MEESQPRSWSAGSRKAETASANVTIRWIPQLLNRGDDEKNKRFSNREMEI